MTETTDNGARKIIAQVLADWIGDRIADDDFAQADAILTTLAEHHYTITHNPR